MGYTAGRTGLFEYAPIMIIKIDVAQRFRLYWELSPGEGVSSPGKNVEEHTHFYPSPVRVRVTRVEVESIQPHCFGEYLTIARPLYREP